MKIQLRELTGKKVKNLRAEGLIPASLYGPGYESKNVVLNEREFKKTFLEAGFSNLINVSVEGEPEKVLVKEVQRNPVTDEVLHVSLYVTNKNIQINAEVPIKFEGVSPSEDLGTGFAVYAMDNLAIRCLPANLPSEFVIDVSKLVNVGDSVTVADMQLPEGVELQEIEPTTAVVYISPAQKMDEVVEETPAEGETAEGAEGTAVEGEEGQGGSSEEKPE